MNDIKIKVNDDWTLKKRSGYKNKLVILDS